MGPFWDDFWIILGSFWDHFGMTFQIPIYFKRTYFMNHTNCLKLVDFFVFFLICPIFIKDFIFFKSKIQSISCTIYFNSGPTFKKKWVLSDLEQAGWTSKQIHNPDLLLIKDPSPLKIAFSES